MIQSNKIIQLHTLSYSDFLSLSFVLGKVWVLKLKAGKSSSEKSENWGDR